MYTLWKERFAHLVKWAPMHHRMRNFRVKYQYLSLLPNKAVGKADSDFYWLWTLQGGWQPVAVEKSTILHLESNICYLYACIFACRV